MITREDALSALETQLKGVPQLKLVSRRLKIWSDVPDGSQPALFIVDGQEVRTQQPPQGLPTKLLIKISLVLYINTGNPESIPSIEMNNILDAIDQAFAPDDIARNVFTLNGLVYRCWIEGVIRKIPGDLEGPGMATIPVMILLP